MITLRSKHYKFIRKELANILEEKYTNSSTLGTEYSSLTICGENYPILILKKYKYSNKHKNIVKRKIYAVYTQQQYTKLKNIIQLEQLYNVPLIGENLST